MQPASHDTWKPGANMLLVAVPERFVQKYEPGKPRLVLPSGSDNWQELGEQIALGLNVQIETDEQPIPVRQGRVLAVPERLTEDMHLCAGPFTRLVPHMETVLITKNGQTRSLTGPDGAAIMRSTGRLAEQNIPRTAADITQRVEVGDTIHFDPYALNDASEVAPGVYLIGYVDVIAVIMHLNWREQMYAAELSRQTGSPKLHTILQPIGGYVLLTRVWADDVTDEPSEEGGLVKCRKNAAGLVTETSVPPLPGEGVVAWHSAPLRGTRQEVQVGDRVVVDPRHARVETIGGVEYLAVRQDFLLLMREPKPALEAAIGKALADADAVLAQMERDLFHCGQSRCYVGPEGCRLLMPCEHLAVDELLVTLAKPGYLPLHHHAYDA